MLKKEFKKAKKGFKQAAKDNKKEYKSTRPVLKLRIKGDFQSIIKKFKYYIKVFKIVYKSLFHAYYRIVELKKELDTAYEKIKSLEVE